MHKRLRRLPAVLAVIVAGLVFGLPGVAGTWAADGDVAKQRAGNVDLPRFPSISPDGSQVVFSWRGSLWLVPIEGGRAIRVTSHPSDDLQSAWSRDGSRIAFTSSRDGYGNIWIMNADGTDIRQVTRIDRPCVVTGFGVDAEGHEVITFEASIEGDVYRSLRPYMVSPEGGDLIRVHDAFGSHPVISADGKQVAFTRGGYYYGWNRRHYRGSESKDVWIYNRENDTFRQLTRWAGNDGKARWGGLDGRTLLYLSDRELDTVNLYRMSADEGETMSVRLTSFQGRDVQAFDVSADGSMVVLMVWDSLYRLNLNDPDAQPQRLVITAVEDDRDNFEIRSINRDVSEVALSPDGQVMAAVAYGRLYVRNIDDKSATRRVAPESHARHKDIAWSPDGLRLYFTSDEDGTESIYAATVALTRSEIREQFELALRVEEGDAVEEDEQDEHAHVMLAGMADAADGDEDDEDENEAEAEEEVEEGEAEEDLPAGLDPKRWHDAVSFYVEPVVQSEFQDRNASPSPDGTMLAFRRGRGDLMILNLETGEERALVEGWDHRLHWRWSPDSRHIAYAQHNLNFSSDIYIVPADGSVEPVNITRHPTNDVDPRWSADGRILAFRSNRVNREFDVWAVYLDRDLEALTPKELDKYYEDAAKAARKRKPLPTTPKEDGGHGADDDAQEDGGPKWHLDDAYLRLRRITTLPGSVGNLEMTPGGDRLIFTANIGNRPALHSVKWDGTDRTEITGNLQVQHLTLDGEKIVFTSGGRGGIVNVSGRERNYVDLDDRVRIDLQAQNSQKFLEAARMLGEMFYHNEMKGLDWAAVTAEYHELARQARTPHEFNHVGNRFLGELNASHLGIYARDPGTPNRLAYGRLGTEHDRVELPGGGYGFRIKRIVSDSPAANGPMALERGDIITSVDMTPFGARDTVESALVGRVGIETIVTVLRELEDGRTVELNALVTPISYRNELSLKYRDWVEHNRRMVDQWSDGRVGYIHIQGMNQPSLDVYERDLYAAAGGKEGLLIDVRNNGGGWTADRLLTSIMVQEHAYTIPRGAAHDAGGHYPQDRLFIQRYTLPINMLCNEKSFSNAEIISHAFKSLGRGTLVGQTTYGGVISTGSYTLIDGTTVRMPFRGWYLPDGTDMEQRGAVPDILVPQTPETESIGDDAQLRRALEDLLERL